jgi:hypothetical protein
MMGIDTPCVRVPSTRASQMCLKRGRRATVSRRLWTTLNVKGRRPLVGNWDGHDVLNILPTPISYIGLSMPAL